MPSVLQAIGTPRRQQILGLVWDQERTAGDIHRSLGDLTFGAVSQHLRILREADLVSSRGEGRSRVYAARKDTLGPLRPWLESMWASALYDLKIRAEIEEARRGPRQQKKKRKPRT